MLHYENLKIMAITKTWTIKTLERDVLDGFVFKAFWTLSGKDGEKSLDNVFSGSVYFNKPSTLPSDFISYDSLTEEIVLSWVKNSLGTDLVQLQETELDRNTQTGKPF